MAVGLSTGSKSPGGKPNPPVSISPRRYLVFLFLVAGCDPGMVVVHCLVVFVVATVFVTVA